MWERLKALRLAMKLVLNRPLLTYEEVTRRFMDACQEADADQDGKLCVREILTYFAKRLV